MRLLSAYLQPDYKLFPYVWAHYVPPNSSGWNPHVDTDDTGDGANELTVWLPITDATLDNGCIYVVPGNADDAGWRRFPLRNSAGSDQAATTW